MPESNRLDGNWTFRILRRCLMLFALGLPTAVAPAGDGPCDEEQKLLVEGGALEPANAATSIDGDVIVVGSSGDDTNGDIAGAAHVFRWNGNAWVEEQKLLASDGAAGDNFGEDVAIDGDVIVVGAHRHDNTNGLDAGAAYVFRWNGEAWDEEQKLLASDGAAGDNFGHSVSIDRDVIVVGAWNDNTNGWDSGAAYVFRFDGDSWIDEQKLVASDGAAGDVFGASVSIDGGVIVVGAHGDSNTNGVDAGAAYVFRSSGEAWVEEQKLLASDGAATDVFGRTGGVSIGGDVIVVGARREDTNGQWAGAAYVFRWNGDAWVEEQKLLASDGAAEDNFGHSVSIDRDVIVVGAYWDDNTNGVDAGAAYVFHWNGYGWVEEQKLLASDGDYEGQFGASVSIGGNVIVAWARTGPSGAGAAYVFHCTLVCPADTNDDGFIDVDDLVAVILAWGLNDARADTNADGVVDVDDLLQVILSWGECQDCNLNQIQDTIDVATGTSQDCNGSGVPDECETDCNGNGYADSCDLDEGTSLDCNGNGVPDECDLASGSSEDCNDNGLPDDCENDCNCNGIDDQADLGAGSPDCNGNGVLDECDLAADVSQDCNENGVPDACDIDAGDSEDCNGNDVPDECDVMASDCNGNGVPDICDIDSGDSDDCNGNDVPDECDAIGNDCNGNGIPDDCENDCNCNGVDDQTDIESGASGDCDGDGLPDECESLSNDGCGNAETIVEGERAFCTQGATTVGPDEPDCAGGGSPSIEADVWFRHLSQCDGLLTITVDAEFDPRLVVYSGPCPSSSGQAVACGTQTGPNQTQVALPMTAGTLYRFRVGSADGSTGSGMITVTCE